MDILPLSHKLYGRKEATDQSVTVTSKSVAPSCSSKYILAIVVCVSFKKSQGCTYPLLGGRISQLFTRILVPLLTYFCVSSGTKYRQPLLLPYFGLKGKVAN